MDEVKLQNEIEKKVKSKLSHLFAKYNYNFNELEDVMKWKPMVLVIGNYSSGKSTLINEFLGHEIQRTGQAPTDDSFTIITASETDEDDKIIPGSSLVNDERLPFSEFKKYGEQLISHMRMKQLNLPFLNNLAIIDSPGMLDSVTEKDRGYDYMSVLGEFARLADLIVLMFDPHKAGTIKETYTTIRNTLPESAGEDRIVFVMSRIDECDSFGDLVRSYGTLCWNLSQMTGRKDIPRVFITYSPTVAENKEKLDIWTEERIELKRRMLAAPNFRISHILHDIDRKLNELRMIVQAMAGFTDIARSKLARIMKFSTGWSVFAFLFLDVLLREIIDFPQETLLATIFSGTTGLHHFLLPAIGAVLPLCCGMIFFLRWKLPRLRQNILPKAEQLVDTDSTYKRYLWSHCRENVHSLIERYKWKDLWAGHHGVLAKIDRFLNRELQEYYTKIRK